MSFETTRRIRLVNLYAILAACASLPYVFIFLLTSAGLAAATLLFFILVVISFFVNKSGHFMVASHTLFISTNIYVFFVASAIGRAAGEQLLYLPIIFGAVLIFDFTSVKSMVFTVAVALVCVIILELTGYSLLNISLSSEEQLRYYYGNIFLTFGFSVIVALFYFSLYAKQNIRNETALHLKWESEKAVNYFATSLYGKNTVDEILWDIAQNCVGRLGFMDCVIYKLDQEKNVLLQKAAFGPKNATGKEIKNSLDIPLGKGIVGSVALSGQAEIITDTGLDPRYMLDDEPRLSEISVPIILQGKVFGVIDAEHQERNFFTQEHLNILTTIASLAANKITKALADEQSLKVTIQNLEAEKIRDLDKLKSKFFANISHEFRTPLTMILGPLDDMMRGTKNNEEKDQFKLMLGNGRKLLRLINDLMELARLDEGILQFSPMQEDIHRFIRTVLASFHSQAVQRKIKFESLISEDPFIMPFDMAKVETIMINLMSSALKFTPAGGSVSVAAKVRDTRFILIVSNSGIQIPLDQHEKIFERFYHGDTAELYDGYGIGLALAKELTAMHGGEISIDSNAEGNTFSISLPIRNIDVSEISKAKRKESPKYSLATESEQVSKKPVVLLVEDNTDLRKYLRKVLDDDFIIHEGADGAQGVQLALHHLPDLVISDVMMPIKDGFELCAEIKNTEVTCHIPVLLLTAKADMESKLEGLETGADYYLAKPFEPRELLTVAKNLIAQRKKLRDNFSKKLLLEPKEWEGASADERFLQKLMVFADQKISEPDFSVEDMQQEMGISRMQLHRKLKALTDQSATEFIRTIRLKRAAEMLQKDFDNVSQVAYQVGFSSLSYFTKCFKDQYGALPSEFSSKNSRLS